MLFYNINMQVYIEEVFFSNAIITFVLLYLTGEIAKNKNKKRLVFASIFGAITSVFFAFIQSNIILALLYKFITGVIIILIGFKFCNLKKFLFNTFTFILITGVFGGIIIAIQNLINTNTIPLYIIALIILALSYIVSIWFNKIYLKEKLYNFLYKTKIVDSNIEYEFNGYLDSGNTLIDPLNNYPIIIVSPLVLQKIYSNINYVDILLGKVEQIKGAHYIDISTAYKGGKMLVFEVDKIQIQNKENYIETNKILCGVSYSNFSKKLNCELLLNPILF